jgi:predicted DNA-binding protein
MTTKQSSMRIDDKTESMISGLQKDLGMTRTGVVKRAVRELSQKVEKEKMSANIFAMYTREIDHGAGIQTITANNGKIVSQSLSARDGLYHAYTGPGNPEFVGQDVSVLRGCGFKRLRSKTRLDEIEMQWLAED